MSQPGDGLERLAAGVLLPGFVGVSPPSWLLRAIEGGLAGVVYFGSNISSPQQLSRLSGALRNARDDVLIAADEEGGDVTRLHADTGSDLPGNAALGVLDDESATADAAAAIARELRLAGVNMNLAPCVDVNSDPSNPVIGVRSFGGDPALVGRHGVAFAGGLQSAGVAACAKHFPGHGDTECDSHVVLPVVRADATTLRERELAPFAAAVAAGVRCVVTAHVRYPGLDAELPATLSPTVLGLLRGELGFDGVVISDALDMHAITGGAGNAGLAAGAVAALRAGVDLLCLGNPMNDASRGTGGAELRLVWRAVVDAARSGELPLARLEQAASRVRSLAAWAAAGRSAPLPPPVAPSFGRELARRALRVSGSVRLGRRPEVLDLRRHVNRAAGRNSAALLDELARRAPGMAGLWGAGAPGRVAGAGGRAGAVVILVDEPQRDASVWAELAALLAARPDAVVVATGWPDPAVDLGSNVVRTFGNGRANAEAAADVLFGHLDGGSGRGS